MIKSIIVHFKEEGVEPLEIDLKNKMVEIRVDTMVKDGISELTNEITKVPFDSIVTMVAAPEFVFDNMQGELSEIIKRYTQL